MWELHFILIKKYVGNAYFGGVHMVCIEKILMQKMHNEEHDAS
jgi:hypothetical protein